MNDEELIEHFKMVTEIAVNKSFEKHIPKIIEECSRRDEASKQLCHAYNLFRRDSDVDDYRKMQQNFDKMRKKELIIFGISITAINAMIMLYLKKFIN